MVMVPLSWPVDRLASRGLVGEKAEGEAMGRVFGAGLQRQLEAEQGIEQAFLGALDDAPAGEIERIVEGRDGFVVATGGAVDIAGGLGMDQPVAGAMMGVFAKDIGIVGENRGGPEAAIFGQRHQGIAVGHIAELMAAALAQRIFEIDRVAAMVADKKFHAGPPGDAALMHDEWGRSMARCEGACRVAGGKIVL